jgi:hypothetical protein
MIVVWMLVSLAIYLAAKMIIGSRATFSLSLAVTLVGVILIGVIWFFVTLFSGLLVGIFGVIMGLFIAFLVWIGLIKSFFITSWLAALGMAVLAFFMFIMIILLIAGILTIVGIASLLL